MIIFIIKDNNQWTKDDEKKVTIKQVVYKNIKQISEWQKNIQIF
jgi:hypothetical protein